MTSTFHPRPSTTSRRRDEALHVGAGPGLGTDDREVATYAATEGYVILTNDSDFLDTSAYPDVTVFYYPESDLPAWDLATAIADVERYFETQDELPRTVYL